MIANLTGLNDWKSLNLPQIAIDYTAAYEQGAGIGRYVRELVAHLAQEDSNTPYRLFVAGAKTDNLPLVPADNFSWKPTRISPIWLTRIWHRLRFPLPIEVFTGSVDLYHATDFVLPPTRPGTKTILTVHDLSFVRVPESASPPLKKYLDDVVPRSVHRATHVLADSTATKQDLIDLYGVSPDKITVLLCGIDSRFQRVSGDMKEIRDKYKLADRPYVFSIGTVQPRKNYSRLIEALARLRDRNYDVDLVIAGGKGWLAAPIYKTIEDTCMGAHVHFIGFAADQDLPALYSGAICVGYPSLYEGFGFPILEGMACGTAVITSNVSSMPEVAGDAALMVDPYDVDAITDALQRIIGDDDLRQSLIERGYERVKQFTWAGTAQQLRQIYHDILNE